MANSASYSRVWAALEQSWYPTKDPVSPYKVTADEVRRKILPALEQQRDLGNDAVDLLKQMQAWAGADSEAQRLISGWLATEASKFLPTSGQNIVVPIAVPPKAGYDVFFGAAGFVQDATGAVPARIEELGTVLVEASRWVQASFGTKDNLFGKAGLDVAGKSAVLQQFRQAVADAKATLQGEQRDQTFGVVAALAAELIKSLPGPDLGRAPAQQAQNIKLRDEAFAILNDVLTAKETSRVVVRALVGYLAKSKSFRAQLSSAQQVSLDTAHKSVNPVAPFDYAKWDAQQKSVIHIDHCAGQGEGFLWGFAKQLQADGFGDRSSGFKVVRGDTRYGPCDLSVVIPKSDPANKWGRDMTIEVHLRPYNRDLYAGMGEAKVDIVSYGGHSGFAKNTLESLQNAPDQVGDKVILRDLCCGADTRNAESEQYPEGSANAVTSIASTYFRTTKDAQGNEYTNECEGFSMLRAAVRGVLGKGQWKDIGEDLKNEANWSGHDSKNNWSFPGDDRNDAFGDLDGDGIPNVYDVIPSYNTFDVKESIRDEFRLKAPNVPADQIKGKRGFQAIQFANTATNYNPTLQPENRQRRLAANPAGLFFDGKTDSAYVKFQQSTTDNRILVQLSSALAPMSMESLRAVLYFEFAKYLLQQGRAGGFTKEAEQNAMALLFVQATLEYDSSYRDAEVFEGIKAIYGFGSAIDHNEVSRILSECDHKRHNYTGDKTGAMEVFNKYQRELQAPAGTPQRAVA